ncbi:MAG: DUF2911 domain-containing protein [Bacteroidia bacterium]|nr:DUF2911 domain-containing protein [Bacteroidia bacterium]
MNKILRWSLIVLGGLVVLLFIAFKVMQSQTKKASPERNVAIAQDSREINVFYNSPSKRGREIFGALVPYGKVWRTGANEATTFTTSAALRIGGKELPAGTYTLWTIPGESSWTVIFNSKSYPWGVNMKSEAAREAEFDVLQAEAPVEPLAEPVEMFDITFDNSSGLAMVMTWDKVRVRLPIE